MNQQTKHRHKFSLFDEHTGNIPCGNIVYIIAFFIPVIIFTALYFAREIFPFGNNCYLRSDMYHQYAPFFSELWYKIRNAESLTYSWDIGMGTNFTSLYAYYLASPANWIIVLFPQKYMIEIMNTLIILKLSLSSVSMTHYISRHFSNKNICIALFGLFYAFSGYVAAYSWNIMWLDCLILVPLIMLGLERLVNEDKCFLYCISLGLCIFTNYYIAIMVLPEFYTFSLSASSDIAFPKKLSLYFSILNMLTRQLINVPVHLGLEHYPNIYCGVAVFLLYPLYVMDKDINLCEKIGKSVLLLVFLTAFNLNIPNFIWHGFHYPNSLPCRQSFIYIFFLLTMCYEALSHIKRMTSRQLGIAVWISLGLLVLIEQVFAVDETYDFKAIYLSGAFILVYAGLMIVYNKTNWKLPVTVFLAFIVCIIECTINMDSTGIGTTNRTSYLLDYDAIKSVTQTVRDEDTSFYRMDKKFGARSKNDGAWHNYHSISTFSSTSSAGMSELFGKLGFEHSMNAYGYNGATLVTESLFSVKYTITNRILTSSSLREYYVGDDGEFVYENKYTLPLGFITYNNAGEWNPSEANGTGIENQNSLIQTLTGIANVFTLTYENATDSSFEVKPVKAGHLYMVVRNTTCDNVTATINNSEYTYSGLKNGNHIIDLGYAVPADTVVISGDSAMNAIVYTLETSRFTEAYNILNGSSLSITSFKDTKIKGTITANKAATLIFSIPYDKGWKVYIDGRKVETSALYDALLSVQISEGSHEITLKYTPVNLIKGCLITALCIIILIGIYILKKKNITINILKTASTNKAVEADDTYNALSEDSADNTLTDLDVSSAMDINIVGDNDINMLDSLDDFDNLDSDEINSSEE